MKENYRAWDIQIIDFPSSGTLEGQLNFLLRFAILAPSSHNSQPWDFRVEQNSINVFVSPDRRLVVGDSSNRLLYISIGCAIKNILIAADYYGFSPTVHYFPVANDFNHVAKIIFNEKQSTRDSEANHLIFSITKRVTNRNPYTSQPLPDDFLDFIRRCAQMIFG